jgi:hypothetical protein
LRYLAAAGEEASETVAVTGRMKEGAVERLADFEWSTLDIWFAIGWELGCVRPMLGAACTRFELEKELVYNIPDLGPGPGANPVANALNSEPSWYTYENRSDWIPFIAVEIDVFGPLAFAVYGSISGDPSGHAALTLQF